MPNNAPIVIKDGKATPVDHTFSPKGQTQSGNEYLFRDTKAGVIDAGQVSVTLSRRPDQSQARTERVIAKVQQPKVVSQTVNGVTADAVAYTNLFTCDFVVSKTATAEEKADLVAYAKNLIDTTFARAMVINGETIW